MNVRGVSAVHLSLTATATAGFVVLIAWAAIADMAAGTIPNALVLLLAAFFVVFAGATGFDAARLALHAACGALVLVCGFGLYQARLFGAGDAKLLAAAALWFGRDGLPLFLAGVALAGGTLSTLHLLARAAQGHSMGREARLKTVPFGVAIALGAFAAAPDAFLFAHP